MCLLVVLPALSQCAPPEPPQALDGVVRNPEPTQGSIIPGREVLRIGSLDGVGPSTFGRVSALQISPSGAIHIVDAMSQDIRIFDSSARYVRTVGRKGEGPGDTSVVFSLEAPLVPVTRAEVDSVISEYKTRRDVDVDRSRVPHHRPAIARLTDMGAEGVGVFAQIEGSVAGQIFDVFDREGRYRYRVNFGTPVDVSPPPIYVKGRLYAVRKDEFDVPFVVALEWTKPGGPD